MELLIQIIPWHITLLVIGIITYPILIKYIPVKTIDYGYAFAKIVGIIIITFTTFLLTSYHILPFGYTTLISICVVLSIYSFSLLKNITFTIPYNVIVIEECIFFLGLLFLSYIRSFEPSIESLEKFMDFGFIQSIIHMGYGPPLDMWYGPTSTTPQGFAINYYYFGHMYTAILITLSSVKAAVGYNLALATILAFSLSQTFSILANVLFLYNSFLKKTFSFIISFIFALLGAILLNFGSNLHTIYLFTKGYGTESPVPFWTIWTGVFTDATYWYPNATRFIPFTIHEFPIYSYVVADLHGHVLSIPFSLLIIFFHIIALYYISSAKKITNIITIKAYIKHARHFIYYALLSGFLAGISFMTNAFDAPIYLGLFIVLTILFSRSLYLNIYTIATLGISFYATVITFLIHFKPFASGIGVNCAPQFLINLHKLGPFLFEQDKCQISEPYMLFILWGGFFIGLITLIWIIKTIRKTQTILDNVFLALYAYAFLLIIVPEFIYIKDIYPTHFRANTMFKLGYQAFMIFSICFTYSLFRLYTIKSFIYSNLHRITFLFFVICNISVVILMLLYPRVAIKSFYGLQSNTKLSLSGDNWLQKRYPGDYDVINYLQKNVTDQQVILEAQGDSYTNYGRISVFTGMPTVAGWLVHEWLWRGDSDILSERIQDINSLYTTSSIDVCKPLLSKYFIKYVVIGNLEREKYPSINDLCFTTYGKKVFVSPHNDTTLYKIDTIR